jgi:hypothetical protein
VGYGFVEPKVLMVSCEDGTESLASMKCWECLG